MVLHSVCDDKRAEPESKALNLIVSLHSQPLTTMGLMSSGWQPREQDNGYKQLISASSVSPDIAAVLHSERIQLKWSGLLIRLPYGNLPMEFCRPLPICLGFPPGLITQTPKPHMHMLVNISQIKARWHNFRFFNCI